MKLKDVNKNHYLVLNSILEKKLKHRRELKKIDEELTKT
jgi:hypothetical protein